MIPVLSPLGALAAGGGLLVSMGQTVAHAPLRAQVIIGVVAALCVISVIQDWHRHRT